MYSQLCESYIHPVSHSNMLVSQNCFPTSTTSFFSFVFVLFTVIQYRLGTNYTAVTMLEARNLVGSKISSLKELTV